MDHFFSLAAILIFSCIVQFFYFTSQIKNVVQEEELSEIVNDESVISEKSDSELSPEKFKNFNYYIEKFS